MATDNDERRLFRRLRQATEAIAIKNGRSGNKTGRRKGSKNHATILSEELNSMIVINDNGNAGQLPK
jgi:hypothetical protein